ncbi:MAG: LolA-related protein, partial [Glutamicibacter sp.]
MQEVTVELLTDLAPEVNTTSLLLDRVARGAQRPLFSVQRDGSRRVELDARQQPAMRSVNAVMFALISGDAQALSAQFNVHLEALPDNAWTMRLTPRSPMLAKVFTGLSLSGDRYVREVEITEANQDVTRIHFSSLSALHPQLTAEEGA